MARKMGNNENNAQMTAQVAEALEQIGSREDLKRFLAMLIQKMDSEQTPPVYVLTMMNHLLTLPDIYSFLDDENKEMARAIWLRMKQLGVQLRNPPVLFGEEQV